MFVYQWTQTEISFIKSKINPEFTKPISIAYNKLKQAVNRMSKIRIQVTIRDDIVKWMDKQIETRKYASRSHAIEYAVLQLLQDDKSS